MGDGTDVEVTPEVVRGVREDWPELEGRSFGKEFSSQQTIEALEQELDQPALPKQGGLSPADRQRVLNPELSRHASPTLVRSGGPRGDGLLLEGRSPTCPRRAKAPSSAQRGVRLVLPQSVPVLP